MPGKTNIKAEKRKLARVIVLFSHKELDAMIIIGIKKRKIDR
jgi:hypothetical protein